MKSNLRILLVGLSSVTCAAYGQQLAPLTQFQANTPARASEVNANFEALRSAANNNSSRTSTLEATVAGLQTTIANAQNQITAQQAALLAAQGQIATQQTALTAAQNQIAAQQAALTTAQNQIAALQTLFAGVTRETVNGQPTVRFSGVNVQIVSGAGTTISTPNGRGNLIIGYDEMRVGFTFVCSIGTDANGNPIPPGSPQDSAACNGAGGTWAASHKSGSHYLVVGLGHNYSQYGGILVGAANTSNNAFASVSGGANNTASGNRASITGGSANTASGEDTTVSGGQFNTASGRGASVSGGNKNIAIGEAASVSAGFENTASGNLSSVSGGNGCDSGADSGKWVVGVRPVPPLFQTGCSGIGN